MSKNDDRILELKKKIEEKKKAVAERKIRFVPETNCVLNMGGTTINLNVCSDDALVLLLIRLNAYLMSAKDLGMNDFEAIEILKKDMDRIIELNNGGNIEKEFDLFQAEALAIQALENTK